MEVLREELVMMETKSEKADIRSIFHDILHDRIPERVAIGGFIFFFVYAIALILTGRPDAVFGSEQVGESNIMRVLVITAFAAVSGYGIGRIIAAIIKDPSSLLRLFTDIYDAVIVIIGVASLLAVLYFPAFFGKTSYVPELYAISYIIAIVLEPRLYPVIKKQFLSSEREGVKGLEGIDEI